MRLFVSRKPIITVAAITFTTIATAIAMFFAALRMPDWITLSLFLFGVVGLLTNGYVIWIKRHSKDGEWFAGLIGFVSSAAIMVLGTMQGLTSASDSDDVKAKLSAETQANAQLRLEVEKLRPKPFKIRLRDTLSQIDPNILKSLAKGQRGIRIELPEGPTNELKKLAEEPEGRRLMVVEEGQEGRLVFGTAGGGFRHDVLLTLDPAILVEDRKSVV